jgi:hypothetical protein
LVICLPWGTYPDAGPFDDGDGGVSEMSKSSKRLVREMVALVEVSEDLRKVLLRYEKGSAEVAARVERGEQLTSALEAVKGPIRRREVTDALDEFEAARHQVRLAMFALGSDQGTNASELGRQLAFSRQLASRLATEAKETLS